MKILWCKTHSLSGVVSLFLEDEPHCPVAWKGTPEYSCRMVPMRLIPDNAETVNLEKLAAALKKPWPVHWEKSSIIAAAQAWLALDGETP